MTFPIMKCDLKVKNNFSKLSVTQSKFLSTSLEEGLDFVFFL